MNCRFCGEKMRCIGEGNQSRLLFDGEVVILADNVDFLQVVSGG